MPPPTKRASQPQNKLPTLQEATNEISTKASFLASNEAAVASESSKGGKFSENIFFCHISKNYWTKLLFADFCTYVLESRCCKAKRILERLGIQTSSFQFWWEIWIQVVVILLQLYWTFFLRDADQLLVLCSRWARSCLTSFNKEGCYGVLILMKNQP